MRTAGFIHTLILLFSFTFHTGQMRTGADLCTYWAGTDLHIPHRSDEDRLKLGTMDRLLSCFTFHTGQMRTTKAAEAVQKFSNLHIPHRSDEDGVIPHPPGNPRKASHSTQVR